MVEHDVTDQQQTIDALADSVGAPVELSVTASSDRLSIVRAVVERTLYVDDWAVDDVTDVLLGVDEVCSQIIAASDPLGRLSVSIAVSAHAAIGRIDGAVGPGLGLDTTGFGWHVVRTVTDARSIEYVDDASGRHVTVRFAKRRSL